jgi:hypothetical protein
MLNVLRCLLLPLNAAADINAVVHSVVAAIIVVLAAAVVWHVECVHHSASAES